MSNECVNIKGTKYGLIILMDGNSELAMLRDELEQKLEKNKGFFKGARFTIHFVGAEAKSEVLEEFKTYCVGLGMLYDPEIPYINNQLAAASDMSPTKETPHSRPVADIPNEALPVIGLTSGEAEEQSLLIDHNLRSGQKVIYPGNIIVLGDVNPGAEIIAGGHIVVMGTLRGIAHAGASGDSHSTIVAYNLEPTQIRIGEKIGRSPDQSAGSMPLAPEVATLTDGQICIENLGSHIPHRNFSKQ